MRLQDLTDDLAEHGIGGHHRPPDLGTKGGVCWADRLARRVADLYLDDETPSDKGDDLALANFGVIEALDRTLPHLTPAQLGGAAVAVKDAALAWLARYLFAKEG